MVPDNAGTASSFPMGFSWGIAGAGIMLFGGIADRIGVMPTLEILSVIPIAGGLLALALPNRIEFPPVSLAKQTMETQKV